MGALVAEEWLLCLAVLRRPLRHERGRTLFAEVDAERWQLAAVVIETYALLVARLRDGWRHGIEFLDRISRTAFRIERFRAGDGQRAIALLKQHKDNTYSLSDAWRFVVMERLQLKEAISFDRHFKEYGHLLIL